VQTAAGAGVTLTAVLRPANAGGDPGAPGQDIVVGTRTDKIGYLSPGQAKQLRFWVSVPGQVADGNYRLMTIATMSAPSTNDAMAGATAPASSAASAMLIDGPTIAIGSVPTAGIVETDAKAIARWDVVPFQTIDRPFAVGVVAFHINGIDRVEFTVNGGEPIVAGEMSFNPQSGVEEYWFVLDPAEYPDGELVIDATVHPVLGTPRVLAGAFGGDADNGEYSLVLHANARGSLTRQQITIGPGDSLADALANVADGGEILLRPGVYNIEEMKGWSREFDRWVTIRPADGVDRSDVMIKLDERRVMNVRGSKLHWQNLTFDFSTIRRVYTSRGDVHWFDSVHFFDSNGWAKVYEDGAFQTMHPFATGFITDSRIEDMAYGAAGFELVRNVHMNKISGDAFQQSELIVNSSVNDVDNDIIPQHADVFQYWAPQDTRLLENRIVYNVQGTNLDSQHFFMRTGGGGTFRDFAFVNIDLRRKEGVEVRDRASQLHTTHEHVLFMNVFTEHRMLLRGEGSAAVGEEYLPTDVLFQGSFFNSATMDQIAPWEDVIARDNTIVA
jgi:hypothetical protein